MGLGRRVQVSSVFFCRVFSHAHWLRAVMKCMDHGSHSMHKTAVLTCSAPKNVFRPPYLKNLVQTRLFQRGLHFRVRLQPQSPGTHIAACQCMRPRRWALVHVAALAAFLASCPGQWLGLVFVGVCEFVFIYVCNCR